MCNPVLVLARGFSELRGFAPYTGLRPVPRSCPEGRCLGLPSRARVRLSFLLELVELLGQLVSSRGTICAPMVPRYWLAARSSRAASERASSAVPGRFPPWRSRPFFLTRSPLVASLPSSQCDVASCSCATMLRDLLFWPILWALSALPMVRQLVHLFPNCLTLSVDRQFGALFLPSWRSVHDMLFPAASG